MMKYHISQEQAEFSFAMKPLPTKKRSSPSSAVGKGDLSQYTWPQNVLSNRLCVTHTPHDFKNHFETKSLQNLTHPNCGTRAREKVTPYKKENLGEVDTEAFSEQSSLQELKASTSPRIMSVTEVTRHVKELLEKNIGEVWIEGEISNYRKQSSGHHYFTLKDAEAQIACVLFARSAAALQGITLKEGMAVQLFGEVSVYQARGQYQLIVRLVQPKGHGLLQAKLEALKQKLAAEGLFDATRKRPLPRLPKRIGVVTSPTGAALADFLKVLHRRHPGLHVVIHPVRVQGQGAAQEIADAITSFSREKQTIGPVDLIVVTRGGGSLEDLWEFNEEIVVRAIVASTVPVVSGIGHEIDFTLADFAADLRAPTPSAAAELIAADGEALLEKGFSLLRHLSQASLQQLEQLKTRLFYLESASLFRAPEDLLSELEQRKDYAEEKLLGQMRYRCEQLDALVRTMQARLRFLHPQLQLREAQKQREVYDHQLSTLINHHQALLKARFENLRSSFATLSPDATLARGFTITRNQQGKVLTSAKASSSGKEISTQFTDGVMVSIVSQ